jgi:hypothetical protein
LSVKDKMVPCGCVWSAWRLTNASEPPRDFPTLRVQLDMRIGLFVTYDRHLWLDYVSQVCRIGLTSVGHLHLSSTLLVAADGA